MSEVGAAATLIPERLPLTSVRDAAEGCTACHSGAPGTQTVSGEGRKRARLLLVGEQPGDREHLEGRRFVGPAGRLLDDALVEAGFDRDDVYLTNVVKHFKWKPEGSGGSTRSRTGARSLLAVPGWTRNSRSSSRTYSSVSEPRRLTRFSDATCASRATAAGYSSASWRRWRSRRCIRRRSSERDHDERQREQALYVDDLRLAANEAARSG